MSSRSRTPRLFASTLLVLGMLGPGLIAQTSGKKPLIADDQEFARLVKDWTTRPDFISPLVDHLPKVTGIPSPKDVLGHHIGEPKKLTYYADILK